ncbi:hypothetical protein GCM10010254_05700 [Streptomyces chromofuscus]|nr:hypothetical protein GCM10010254_05700 [Streptomyces chromofuscus]
MISRPTWVPMERIVGGEEGDDRAQVLEVDQLQALGVGVVEDQAEGLPLGPVEPEHLGEQDRTEAGDGGAQRDAVAHAAQGVEPGREAGRRPLPAHLGGAGADLVVRQARRRDARRITLDVREEDGDAVRRELLGDQLDGPRLAGTGGARDQPVPAEHRQRDAKPGLRQAPAVPQQGAEIQRGTGERVAVGDPPGLLGEGGSAAGCLGAGGRGPGLAVTHVGPLFRFTPVHGIFSSVALPLHGCARNVSTGRLSV